MGRPDNARPDLSPRAARAAPGYQGFQPGNMPGKMSEAPSTSSSFLRPAAYYGRGRSSSSRASSRSGSRAQSERSGSRAASEAGSARSLSAFRSKAVAGNVSANHSRAMNLPTRAKSETPSVRSAGQTTIRSAASSALSMETVSDEGRADVNPPSNRSMQSYRSATTASSFPGTPAGRARKFTLTKFAGTAVLALPEGDFGSSRFKSSRARRASPGYSGHMPGKTVELLPARSASPRARSPAPIFPQAWSREAAGRPRRCAETMLHVLNHSTPVRDTE